MIYPSAYTKRQTEEMDILNKDIEQWNVHAKQMLVTIIEIAKKTHPEQVKGYEGCLEMIKLRQDKLERFKEAEQYQNYQFSWWANPDTRNAHPKHEYYNWEFMKEYERKHKDDHEWAPFGEVARSLLHMQCQYARDYLDPAEEKYRELNANVRWMGDLDDYHGLLIHRDDIAEFVEKVLAWRRAKGIIA